MTPSFEDRLRGAIRGQFVGDAASLGAHWIYNLIEMKRAYPSGVQEFEAPLEGHYHYGKRPGEFTHYGDAALLMLQSVAELGRFDPVDFGKRFVEKFGSRSYKGYIDKATRGTLENKTAFEETNPGKPFDFQQGADDDQLATVSRLAPVVVAHLRDEDLMSVVESATRVCQNNPRAVAYNQAHALILVELLQGRDVHSAMHRAEEIIAKDPVYGAEIRKKIRAAMAVTSKSATDATMEFGQSCPLISSFPSSVQCFVKHSDSFQETILSTIRADRKSVV